MGKERSFERGQLLVALSRRSLLAASTMPAAVQGRAMSGTNLLDSRNVDTRGHKQRGRESPKYRYCNKGLRKNQLNATATFSSFRELPGRKCAPCWHPAYQLCKNRSCACWSVVRRKTKPSGCSAFSSSLTTGVESTPMPSQGWVSVRSAVYSPNNDSGPCRFRQPAHQMQPGPVGEKVCRDHEHEGRAPKHNEDSDAASSTPRAG